MSDRPLLKPFKIVNAVSTGASITSNPIIIQRLPGISFELAWTGTTNGTFSFEVSNSYQQASDGTVIAAGTWNALPSSAFVGTLPAPAGSSGNGFVDLLGTEAYAVRVVFTRTSGTGLLTVTACAKVW